MARAISGLCRPPPRSSAPSGPAARGTRRPCPTPGRPWRAAPRAARPRGWHPPRRRSGTPARRRAPPAPSGCPSFSWNVMPPSATAISSSGFFRSCSQKNLASDSRARITFSLPAMISLPPSLATQVGHQQELVGELARARMLEREALLVLLHRQHQALGRHRQERLVEAAHQHVGPFGEPGVLGQQRLVLDQRQLVLLGQRVRLLGDQRRARLGVEDHLVRLEAAWRSRARPSPRTARCRGSDARAWCRRLDALDLERHHLAVEQADDRVQRPHPGRSCPCPSASTSARGTWPPRAGTTSAMISLAARPGLSMRAT